MTGLDGFAAWAAVFDIADVPDDVVHGAGLQVASAFTGAQAGTTANWFDATAIAATQERYRVRADEHAGACGRALSETTATVRGKFEHEVGPGSTGCVRPTSRDWQG